MEVIDSTNKSQSKTQHGQQAHSDQTLKKELKMQTQAKIKKIQKQNTQAKDVKGIKDLKLKVEEVHLNEDYGDLMPTWIQISLKNESSYLIATNKNGFKVIENKQEIYAIIQLKGRTPLIVDVVYCKPLNCYFLNLNSALYRKNIDKSDPFLFLNVYCGMLPGYCSLNYYHISQKLIISNSQHGFTVVDLVRKRIDFRFKTIKGKPVSPVGVKAFGRSEDRILAVSSKGGYIFFVNMSFKYKKILSRSYHKIELNSQRFEIGNSVAVCSKNQYACVEIKNNGKFQLCSKMMIFAIKSNSVAPSAVIDEHPKVQRFKYALEFYDCVGSSLLFVGLSMYYSGKVQLYEFNLESGDFRSLESKKVFHNEKDPYKIHRIGESFFYTGRGAKVMKLTLEI